MIVCSVLVIARKRSEYAVGGLLGVVVIQALGYGLIFDLNFFLRNLSVIGGLLMVLSDSWVRKKFVPAGLPQIDERDRKMYFQLAGRVLLIFLFIGFVVSGTWTLWRVLVCIFGFVACVMVVVGFKAKWSAVILVVLLSIFNILVNNFWTVCERSVGLQSITWTVFVTNPHIFSFIHITLKKTSRNTTSSKSCPLCKSCLWPRFFIRFELMEKEQVVTDIFIVEACCSWLIWALASSVLTRRRKYTS
jgi:uncharacterized membrane protein YphA (DoxX/SURF4 family)